MSVILGADIGGTYVRAALMDGGLQTHSIRCAERREVFAATDGLTGFLRDLSDTAGVSADAVVLGIPGTVNSERRRVINCPNAPGLELPELFDNLEQVLGAPVFLERDVNLLLLRDMQVFGADGITVGIYFGTGLGNSIAIDGVPLSGCDGVAGELGHIPMVGKKDICTCGNVGCLENYASGRALEAIASREFPGSPVKEVFTRHAAHPALTAFIDAMATAVAIEVNILNPHRVIIGGGVPRMPDFPNEALIDAIRRYVRQPLPADTMTIHFSHDAGGLIGAAIYGDRALRKLKEGGIQ